MIRKDARTNLNRDMAELAFREAQKLAGAVVEMIEQADGRWTVAVTSDAAGAAVSLSDVTALKEADPVPDRSGGAALATPAIAPVAAPVAAPGATPSGTPTGAAPADDLGRLSRRFESNGNPGAIGHDSTGGFSYGAYQIATRTGTMTVFLQFLRTGFPRFFARLDAAGGAAAATGGGQAFRQAWLDLARDPAFADSQHGFIKFTHYDPFAAILKKDLDLDATTHSETLKNVIWSVAVQHGPGNRVFHNALAGQSAQALAERRIIRSVYAERSDMDRYFPSSTPQVRQALIARFAEECRLALQMLV
jgi:hypothetical protein